MNGSSSSSPARVAIVGAGLAGLTAGRALHDAGLVATLFDKGRRAGGRLSTRRADAFQFDHGAQYLTARAPEFRVVVDGLVGQGVLAEWTPRLARLGGGERHVVEDGRRRFVGVPTMSAFPRALAPGLDLREHVRIERVLRDGGHWTLVDTDGGRHGGFDAVLITTPVLQARDLLGGEFPGTLVAAGGATLRPCLAVMLGFSERYDVPFDGAWIDGSPLAWIARNSSKPGRPAGESWILHADHRWTEARLGEDRQASGEELVRELAHVTGAPLPHIEHRAVHLWGYALADPALEEGCLVDRELGLALAGDWCAGNRVEGAWHSGRAAAAALIESLVSG